MPSLSQPAEHGRKHIPLPDFRPMCALVARWIKFSVACTRTEGKPGPRTSCARVRGVLTPPLMSLANGLYQCISTRLGSSDGERACVAVSGSEMKKTAGVRLLQALRYDKNASLARACAWRQRRLEIERKGR